MVFTDDDASCIISSYGASVLFAVQPHSDIVGELPEANVTVVQSDAIRSVVPLEPLGDLLGPRLRTEVKQGAMLECFASKESA